MKKTRGLLKKSKGVKFKTEREQLLILLPFSPENCLLKHV